MVGRWEKTGKDPVCRRRGGSSKSTVGTFGADSTTDSRTRDILVDGHDPASPKWSKGQTGGCGSGANDRQAQPFHRCSGVRCCHVKTHDGALAALASTTNSPKLVSNQRRGGLMRRAWKKCRSAVVGRSGVLASMLFSVPSFPSGLSVSGSKPRWLQARGWMVGLLSLMPDLAPSEWIVDPVGEPLCSASRAIVSIPSPMRTHP